MLAAPPSLLSAPPPLSALPFPADSVAEQIRQRNNVRVLGAGPGKPTLLLCNGFGYNQRVWQPLATALARDYQVVLFDHVGTGGSDLAAYDEHKYAQLAGYAQDLLALCQALALEQVILLGHSVGAMIALLAACQCPAFFARVVLLTSSPCYLNEPGYYGGYERADLEQLLMLLATDYHGWATLFVDLLLGPLAAPGLAEELHQCLSATASPMAQQFARLTFLSDHRAQVPNLTLPTLVIQCQQDVIAPAEVGTYLLQHLPQAQLVTLPAAGHCPQLSAPLDTLAALRSFLA